SPNDARSGKNASLDLARFTKIRAANAGVGNCAVRGPQTPLLRKGVHSMRIIWAGWRWALVLVVVAAAQLALLKAAPVERSDLDKSIYASLKDVINRGADLYNSGDPAACYHVYQGALLAVEALLDHYPDLQKEIKTALADAERNPDIRRRAYALRGTLDKVRATTNPKKTQ